MSLKSYIPENGKNPTTGSQDIVQRRKCHANAYAVVSTLTPTTTGSALISICPPYPVEREREEGVGPKKKETKETERMNKKNDRLDNVHVTMNLKAYKSLTRRTLFSEGNRQLRII